VGHFELNLTVDSTTFTSPLVSGFICKYDNLGKTKWVKTVPTWSRFWNITSDKNNNIYVVGEFRDSVVFSSNIKLKHPASNTRTAFFIAKLDSNGNYHWAKMIHQNNHSLSYFP